MKSRLNKAIKFSLILLVVGFAFSKLQMGAHPVRASRGGPDPSNTDAPALGSFSAETNCTACHFGTGNLNASGGSITLTAPSSYEPGQKYTIQVALSRGSLVRFGFQVTALDASGNLAGTFTITDSNRTQLVDGDPFSEYKNRKYVEQTTGGSAIPSGGTAGSNQWSFDWTAPATRIGKITFYAAGNCTNNNNLQTGDFIYTTTALVRPSIASVNAASSDSSNNNASNGGIISAYGIDLASSTVTASGDADPNTPGIQLPSTLGGTTVTVKDSGNVTRTATLFFVSPNQVNYLLPTGMLNGAATLTIASSLGTSTGNLTIANVKPGIFTVNQQGTGYAAAQIQRVRSGVTLGFEDVATGSPTAQTAVPIEWKDANDQLYLVLYTTGVRQRSQLSNVLVTVKGASQQVVYAQAHDTYAGLDQINVLLDRSLAGSGDTNVVLTVDGVAANTVKINFK
ncbi:MAG: choice-of-anchor V domain-containing protein [Blastocatellia bacterium]